MILTYSNVRKREAQIRLQSVHSLRSLTSALGITSQCIMLTHLCNLYPHVYIVKLGFTLVLIFALKHNCGFLLESMFYAKIRKVCSFLSSKN